MQPLGDKTDKSGNLVSAGLTRLACVYTTLFGGYEVLNEQPIAPTSRLPFICLTDDPDLRSETWQIRQVEPLFGVDPIRSQRALKLRPHVHLLDFDCSIYIDNSVVLKTPPEALVEQYLSLRLSAFPSIASGTACSRSSWRSRRLVTTTRDASSSN
jgi:hypothetical protein